MKAIPSRVELADLNRAIVNCNKCTRLRDYARLVARKKKRQFADWEYWARPVPGFGDPEARLLVIGLAPAAHGGLRTGRVFTGDDSGRFLVRALNAAGFASQPISEYMNDGLVYGDCYLTAAVKCAPPGDRPTKEEFDNCSVYLDAEIAALRNVRVVLALGSMAFGAFVNHLRRKGIDTKGLKFAHGASYNVAGLRLYASYHPSPRNTNTGKLAPRMLSRLLGHIRSDLDAKVEERSRCASPTRRRALL
jgi:uracil-DNA glycosylase family 4